MRAPWRPWASYDKHERALLVSLFCIVGLVCLWALFG